MGLQRHNFGLAVVCGLPIISAIFVSLRFLARRRRALRLGWDDWLLCLATVLSFGLIGPSVINFRIWNWGYHIWELPRTAEQMTVLEFKPLYASNLSFNLLSIPILPLSKASIILLLLRIGKILTPVRRFLYIVSIFNALAAIIPWILLIFICPPSEGLIMGPTIFGHLYCFDREAQGTLLLFVNSANLLTDVLVFPVPFFIMRELMNTTWRSKVTILLTFASSIGVTILSALKIPFTETDRISLVDHSDKMFSLNYCITHAEANVGIIVACLPTLRGLISRKTFETSERSPTWPSSRPTYSCHISARQGSHFSNRRSDAEHHDWDRSLGVLTFDTVVDAETGSGSSLELVIQGGYDSRCDEPKDVPDHHTFHATLPLPLSSISDES